MEIILSLLFLAAPVDDRPRGAYHTPSLQLHLNDDKAASFGNTASAPDVWFDNNGTVMCLTSTDIDAGGTDGDIWCYTLQGNVISFGSEINLYTNAQQLVVHQGTAANPGLVFGQDDDGTGSGFYQSAANSISLTLNGSTIQTWTTSNISFNKYLYTYGAPLPLGYSGTSAKSLGMYDVLIPKSLEVQTNTFLQATTIDGQFNTNGIIGDAPATCTTGDVWLDNAGVTIEWCFCATTNNWYCSAVTAGPAD